MPRRTLVGLEAVLLEAAAVTLVWIGIAVLEPVAIIVAWGQEFSGAWEMAQVRRLVAPIAIAGLAPASLVVVAWWRVAVRARDGAPIARVALATLGALAGLLVALGTSTGRHFASWGARGPYVALLAIAGVLVGARLVPRIAALERRPAWLAWLGAGALLAAWPLDAFVLPRLYPAFHQAMLVVLLVGGAVLGLGLRTAWERPRWLARAIGGATLAAVAASALLVASAVRALDRLSNLRFVLVDHAPVLGPFVEIAAASRPPEQAPLEGGVPVAPGEIARSLDWSGHDLVLLTVDALRADHVSAYGYPRPTTPHLDTIARRGALFSAAYCPTPHTSYSITSMMTGKYLRPLLALGLGEDSDTWAQDLRLYGWRTAAFYPPAVFFIDEDRFRQFEETHLGFEYAKVEFADPALRERQVAGYLDGAPRDVPLFLWVHFFEPHEPYVVHPDHVFAGRSADEDAYDSEIAAADEGIGRIVALLEARRPGAVVVVTADHGEEFGDHGGRYHGTTVYEEQVRVPLVIAGPGIRPGSRVDSVVQTIDLLPTTLSALGIPRPARLRGRDLGPALAGTAAGQGPGFAFAETDDFALLAEGGDRLVCQRRAAACTLHDVRTDPLERHDDATDRPARLDAMRGTLRAVERDHGRFEGAAGPTWPEALRRGMLGEGDAAVDVAALLDDADVRVRRKAGEVSFALHAPAAAPALRRAAAHDEDEEVRRWSVLALARIDGEAVPPAADSMLTDPSRDWRRRAALALGGRGDARACDAIAAWWGDVLPPAGQGVAEGEPPRLLQDLTTTQDLLLATSRARCRSAVVSLLRALVDVRARPYLADTLGALGDDRARKPLLAQLAAEPYVTTRPHEARALLALGARGDPFPRLEHVPSGPLRLVVLLSDPAATLDASAAGAAVPSTGSPGEPVRYLDLPAHTTAPSVELTVHPSEGQIVALWVAGLQPP
ncbi:MAG TPA: sulfatase-like hydrolase/transferase [Polyangiaceae bacterium]|jgi:xanthosine utilization system XapX-like protein